jgi:2-keto-3-deoxy-galactonokinase
MMTTKEKALELFDAGIPNEIEDSHLKTMLNGHRWGWHQTPFLQCPACERKVGA